MNSFFSLEEENLTEKFLRDGYVIQNAEDLASLELLRKIVSPSDVVDCDGVSVNDLKLSVMRKLNESPDTRKAYYSLAKNLLHTLVGNELCMQKKFNLNIQYPGDTRNLLPIHADTWTGDSPFQVVLWVPFVDCFRTKSMWILPPEHMKTFKLSGTSEEMFLRIEPHIKYLDIRYGEVLVFNSTLPHGNRVNREDSARWSLNCRFKSVFSPYAKKNLGEHFEPITLRAASRVGLQYEHPL